MQSGPAGPEQPDKDQDDTEVAPQAPPSVGPQAPPSWDEPLPGPQAPQAPSGPPQAPPLPTSPGGPQAPEGGGWQTPPPGAPGYGGPVPPGGWQAPIAASGPGWHGAPLASWGSRVGAQLLDWLILTVAVAILGGIVAAIFIAGSNVGGVVVAIVFGLLYLLATLAYAPVLMAREGAHNGQTWGKQIVGITVVRDTTEPVGFWFAALRQVVVIGLLFGWVGSLLFSIPTLVNYLWPLWDVQNRCLHDMVVSTHVVRR